MPPASPSRQYFGITLDDYAAAVLEVVDAAYAAGSGPMAGIVLSAVAERAPEKIGRLVYLAAFMPLPGTPMIDYVRRRERRRGSGGPVRCPPPKIGAMRIDFAMPLCTNAPRSAPMTWTRRALPR
jgi:hypothetical protein